MAIFALIAGYRDSKKHEKEVADLKDKLGQQRDQLTEQKGISLGVASTVGRRLDYIATRVSDPQSKAEISELREEVDRKPVIVYESFGEKIFPWQSGDKYTYVHLWFRNEPTGETAHDAAAKLTWWDIRYPDQKPLFSVDGKWYEDGRVQAGSTIYLLPNRASHGLDLFIYHKPEEDWIYGLSNAGQPIDESSRLHPGIYKVRVTISCEGYSKDFWFQVATGGFISVREYVSPNGEGQEVRDEVRR